MTTPSKPEWGKRRFRLDLSLFGLAVLTGYIIFFGEDTSVNSAAITIMIPSYVALIGTYVFGATWDDKNWLTSLTNKDSSSTSDGWYTPPYRGRKNYDDEH